MSAASPIASSSNNVQRGLKTPPYARAIGVQTAFSPLLSPESPLKKPTPVKSGSIVSDSKRQKESPGLSKLVSVLSATRRSPSTYVS